MGKSWRRERGKRTPSSSCFTRAWQECSGKKRGAARGRRGVSLRRDRKMKSVLLSNVGGKEALCLCWVTGFTEN